MEFKSVSPAKTANNCNAQSAKNLSLDLLVILSTRSAIFQNQILNIKEFTRQLDSFKEGFKLEMSRRRKQKSRIKLREEKGNEKVKALQSKYQMKMREEKDNEVTKADQNSRKEKSRAKLKEEKGKEHIMEEDNEHKLRSRDKLMVEGGPVNLRKEQNVWEKESRKRRIDDDPKALHNNEKKRKKLSRRKQLNVNPKKFKEEQCKRKQKYKLIDTEKKRLKRFRQITMYNAIFTCICCQRNLFECNITKFTNKLCIEIETKKPGLYLRAVEIIGSSPIMVNVNGIGSAYICLACKRHLKAGKLPPMSTMNGLKIYNHDPELKLTELEGNLIAKNIVFVKIF